jgi:hypothetical protein
MTNDQRAKVQHATNMNNVKAKSVSETAIQVDEVMKYG